MGLFFQILGVLFLVMILVIVGGFFLLKAKLRSALSGLEDLKYAVTPPRLHLVRTDDADWKDRSAAEYQAALLRDLGFQDAGTYTTEEMDFLRLQALVKPDDSLYAVVYEHDKAGVWVDLVCRYEDGTSLTYANTAQGGEVDQRPGHGTSRYPELDAAGLYRKILADRPQRPFQPATAEAFVGDFEQAYAEGMDWRNSRGGATEDEIRRIAAAMGQELSDEELLQMRENAAAQALEGLEESLREHFTRDTTMSAAEWERVRDRIVFIHDQLPRDSLEETAWEWASEGLDEDEELAARMPDGLPSREAFAALNNTLPARWQFQKVGTVSQPVEADVYCAPEP